MDEETVEFRPRVNPTLGWPYAALVAGLLVALAFVATDHMLRATVAFGGALFGAAALRAVLPDDDCGGLRVRRKWLDVLLLVVLGAAMLASGFALDLRPKG